MMTNNTTLQVQWNMDLIDQLRIENDEVKAQIEV